MKEMKPELEYVLDNLSDLWGIFKDAEPEDVVSRLTPTHAVLTLAMAVEHVGRVLSDLTGAYKYVNGVGSQEDTDYPVYTYSLPEKPEPTIVDEDTAGDALLGLLLGEKGEK